MRLLLILYIFRTSIKQHLIYSSYVFPMFLYIFFLHLYDIPTCTNCFDGGSLMGSWRTGRCVKIVLRDRCYCWMICIIGHEDAFVGMIVSATSSLTLRRGTPIEPMEKLDAVRWCASCIAASRSNFEVQKRILPCLDTVIARLIDSHDRSM